MFVAKTCARHVVLWIDSTPQDLFKEGVEFASTVDFTKSRTRTDGTTIRFEPLGL
jgi:hypothetical protein